MQAVADPCRGVSRFPQKPPYEIDLNPGSLNTLIEQSDRDALITVVSLEMMQ